MKKTPFYCASCKLDDMVDARNKKCIICNLKQPAFNYPNEAQTLYCKDCKKCDMANSKNKKCITCNLKIPNENYHFFFKQKKTFYCNNCKKRGMVDVNHKTCISCNLSQAVKKYDNHCALCLLIYFQMTQNELQQEVQKN